MKNKLIILFSLIIILFVGIGAVSGENVNATDDGSSDSSNQFNAGQINENVNVSTSADGNQEIPFKNSNESYFIVNGETFYEEPSANTIVDISLFECCSFIIQEAGETVYAFRQDSPLNGYGVMINEQNWHGLKILKQEIDTKSTYFFHSIITENGWVIGQGGSQYNSPSRSIEQIASEIVLSNDISPDALRRIKNILAPYGYGHFV